MSEKDLNVVLMKLNGSLFLFWLTIFSGVVLVSDMISELVIQLGVMLGHGLCLGFQLMQSAESPKTAFDILIRWFKIPPTIVATIRGGADEMDECGIYP